MDLPKIVRADKLTVRLNSGMDCEVVTVGKVGMGARLLVGLNEERASLGGRERIVSTKIKQYCNGGSWNEQTVWVQEEFKEWFYLKFYTRYGMKKVKQDWEEAWPNWGSSFHKQALVKLAEELTGESVKELERLDKLTRKD